MWVLSPCILVMASFGLCLQCTIHQFSSLPLFTNTLVHYRIMLNSSIGHEGAEIKVAYWSSESKYYRLLCSFQLFNLKKGLPISVCLLLPIVFSSSSFLGEAQQFHLFHLWNGAALSQQPKTFGEAYLSSALKLDTVLMNYLTLVPEHSVE